ncbi:hypothetical protein [Streptomyces rubiginosohelvolus]
MGICIDVLIVDWDHLMSAPGDDQRYAMRGWGDVIDQAQQRGWGAVGLRC